MQKQANNQIEILKCEWSQHTTTMTIWIIFRFIFCFVGSYTVVFHLLRICCLYSRNWTCFHFYLSCECNMRLISISSILNQKEQYLAVGSEYTAFKCNARIISEWPWQTLAFLSWDWYCARDGALLLVQSIGLIGEQYIELMSQWCFSWSHLARLADICDVSHL